MIGTLFRASKDLPLARDGSSRFLAWIIGFMAILAAFALAASMLLADLGRGWRAELSGRLTVQVMPGADDESAAALDRRTEDAIGFLRAQPEVDGVEPIGRERVAGMLEPWLGPRLPEGVLPLPRLIDVVLVSGTDPAALGRRLSNAVPGIAVDDHGIWLARVLTLANAVEVAALGVLGLILVAATATVIFTTRAGLAIHDDVIELLHLVGAEDGYIARQFQVHALRLALKGALAGTVLAAAGLAALAALARDAATGMIPDLYLSVPQWAALACLPLVAAVVATLTARVTVMRSLSRMP